MYNILYIILAIYLIVLIILATEFTAYMWHLWGAHSDIVPGVHSTHREHHVADLDHKAHGDFFWVILLLIVFGCVLFWLNHRGYPEYIYSNLIDETGYNNTLVQSGLGAFYLIVVAVFTWNWYIHQAYHTKDHWLNKFDWFKKDKKIHFQHHVDPKVNYGIASHFSDVIFGTYDNPIESEVYSKLNV